MWLRGVSLRGALLATSFAGTAGAGAPTSVAEIGVTRVSVSEGPGASDCAKASDLTKALEPLVGDVEAPDLAIGVRWSRRGGEFRARITVENGGQGERLLASSAESCAELEEHVVAVLALLLDAEGAAPVELPNELPNDSPNDSPNVPEPERDGDGADHFRVSVAALGGVTAGLAPDALGWLGAEATAGRDWWQIGVAFYSTFKDAVPVGNGRIDLSWTGGTLKPCARILGTAETFHALACPLFSVAALQAEAVGYDPLEPSASRPWYSVGGGLSFGGPIIGSLEWNADASALVPLQREIFSVASLGEVVNLPIDGAGGVALWLSAGLGVKIW